MPINHERGGGHWALVAVVIPDANSNSNDVHLQWYNSMNAIGNPNQAATLITNWIRREHPRGQTFNFIEIEVREVPQQEGFVDCGVHVLSAILNLARGEPVSQETGVVFAQVRRDEFANILAQAARAAEPVQMELAGWPVISIQDNSTA